MCRTASRAQSCTFFCVFRLSINLQTSHQEAGQHIAYTEHTGSVSLSALTSVHQSESTACITMQLYQPHCDQLTASTLRHSSVPFVCLPPCPAIALTRHPARPVAGSTVCSTRTIARGGGVTATRLNCSPAVPSTSSLSASADVPLMVRKRRPETPTNLSGSPSSAQPAGSSGASVVSDHACVPLGWGWPGDVHT